jgi:hypothetical protein
MALTKCCPKCISVEISRSHRKNPLEKYLLGAIGVRPYRCMNCDARFYAFSRFNVESSQTNKAA